MGDRSIAIDWERASRIAYDCRERIEYPSKPGHRGKLSVPPGWSYQRRMNFALEVESVVIEAVAKKMERSARNGARPTDVQLYGEAMAAMVRFLDRHQDRGIYRKPEDLDGHLGFYPLDMWAACVESCNERQSGDAPADEAENGSPGSSELVDGIVSGTTNRSNELRGPVDQFDTSKHEAQPAPLPPLETRRFAVCPLEAEDFWETRSKRLPDDLFNVVFLYMGLGEEGEMTEDEIADYLGIAQSTVSGRLKKACHKLQFNHRGQRDVTEEYVARALDTHAIEFSESYGNPSGGPTPSQRFSIEVMRRRRQVRKRQGFASAVLSQMSPEFIDQMSDNFSPNRHASA